MGHWDSQVEVSIQESPLAGNINMGNTDMGCTNNGNEDGQYLYHIYQPVACWMIIIRIWDIRLIVCSLIISIIVISTTITIIFTITTIIIVIITIWDNGRRERLSVCLFTASTASPLDTAFCPLVNLVHSFAAKTIFRPRQLERVVRARGLSVCEKREIGQINGTCKDEEKIG